MMHTEIMNTQTTVTTISSTPHVLRLPQMRARMSLRAQQAAGGPGRGQEAALSMQAARGVQGNTQSPQSGRGRGQQ